MGVMSTPRWRYVLFDLDGTLVDTIALIVGSYEHALRTVLGRAVDEDTVRGWIGRPLRDNFSAVDPERWEELCLAYLEWNTAHTADLLRRYDGVEAMLEALAGDGVRTGVVTSKRRESALRALELAGLSERIPLLTTMADTDVHKPHPEPLWHGLAKVGGSAAQAVYVGDAVVDIDAARAAGMDSVAVRWGSGTPEALAAAGPDVLCDTLTELTAVLLGT